MGVPAFFRWLTRKYPSIIIDCIEQQPTDVNGTKIPVDCSQPNPNGVEFDNFYLDMNGIIHPCTHPEDKIAPKNEDEMMVAIFECIDRLFAIVRPRKLLYMAIDGVAPRAKMNQQRSRRFRAAQETDEKLTQMSKLRFELERQGCHLPPEKNKSEHFDSNCITPGTPFMDRLSKCLNYYIHDRLNNDPAWSGLKVILSDANVPGEGEHKIMDYIRRQRAHPDHDPNTHHCLCGADADLIMLGLATHEPNFTIIREEFVMGNKVSKCELCSQMGHEMKDCKGLEADSEAVPIFANPTRYIFVRLNVLREYLLTELTMPGLPFEYSFERAIDDWVFMCFFVGNDFLPHLPSLEIREGAIDRLVGIYKKTVYRTGGFLTNSGDVNLARVQVIMSDLGAVEDEIFRRRQRNELNFRQRNRERKQMDKLQKKREAAKEGKEYVDSGNEEEAEPADDVKLYQAGYKERYYALKFHMVPDDVDQRYKIGFEYVRGLSWVLKYYYQGCSSWNWYFPYHYAPFASDFVNIGHREIIFDKGQPFMPLEQLMGVFPAASSSHVPSSFAKLMKDEHSPIIDFYPSDFKVDLNGKKFRWQGVALLPFVDENRLKAALEGVYSSLTAEEKKRNAFGFDRLYVSNKSNCYNYLSEFKGRTDGEYPFLSEGIKGNILIDPYEYFQGTTVISPVTGLIPVTSNRVLCVNFRDPIYKEGHKFMAARLPGAIDPPKTLNQAKNNPNQRPFLGFAPPKQQANLGTASFRMLGRHVPVNSVQYSRDSVRGNRNGGNRAERNSSGNWMQGQANYGPPRSEYQDSYNRVPPPRGRYGGGPVRPQRGRGSNFHPYSPGPRGQFGTPRYHR